MATEWEARLDPSDHNDFVARFDVADDGGEPVLTLNERIATFTALPTERAASAGLIVDQTGAYAPELLTGDQAIRLWLSIDPEKRTNEEFGPGLPLEVETTIVTDSVPPRTIQRTWTIVVQSL